MKKLLGLLAVGGLLASIQPATMAGSGCCAGGDSVKADKAQSTKTAATTQMAKAESRSDAACAEDKKADCGDKKDCSDEAKAECEAGVKLSCEGKSDSEEPLAKADDKSKG